VNPICGVKPGDDRFFYFFGACRHACQIFSAVAGMSRCAPAPPGMASATAFMSAAIAAVVPASPAPLTPGGLVFAGTARIASLNTGRSSAPGHADVPDRPVVSRPPDQPD